MAAASNSGLPLTEATILLAIMRLVVASLSSVIHIIASPSRLTLEDRVVLMKNRDSHEWRNQV
jgi:hypothetical protein